MRVTNVNRKTIYAVLVLVGVVLIAGVCIWAVQAASTRENVNALNGPRVAIYVGDKLYTTVPFHEKKVITVDQGDGRVNEITLTGDAVLMTHANCPNQDCVHQSEITAENYETRALANWIICLPNGVTVEYIAGEDE